MHGVDKDGTSGTIAADSGYLGKAVAVGQFEVEDEEVVAMATLQQVVKGGGSGDTIAGDVAPVGCEQMVQPFKHYGVVVECQYAVCFLSRNVVHDDANVRKIFHSTSILT